MTVENVKEYLKAVNLNDYDLGGVEITEEDCEKIVNEVNSDGSNLVNVVSQYLYRIREILDAGLDDIEE